MTTVVPAGLPKDTWPFPLTSLRTRNELYEKGLESEGGIPAQSNSVTKPPITVIGSGFHSEY